MRVEFFALIDFSSSLVFASIIDHDNFIFPSSKVLEDTVLDFFEKRQNVTFFIVEGDDY
jgi:hypothetical protein